MSVQSSPESPLKQKARALDHQIKREITKNFWILKAQIGSTILLRIASLLFVILLVAHYQTLAVWYLLVGSLLVLKLSVLQPMDLLMSTHHVYNHKIFPLDSKPVLDHGITHLIHGILEFSVYSITTQGKKALEDYYDLLSKYFHE